MACWLLVAMMRLQDAIYAACFVKDWMVVQKSAVLRAALRSFTGLCCASQCDTDTCIHSGSEWAGALAG